MLSNVVLDLIGIHSQPSLTFEIALYSVTWLVVGNEEPDHKHSVRYVTLSMMGISAKIQNKLSTKAPNGTASDC